MKKLYSTFALLLVILGAKSQSVTFNYTGTTQFFVVPANVTSVNVDVRGAPGGTASNMTQAPQSSPGGLGGRVQASFAVTPGATLYIEVGGIGMSTNGTLTCITATGGYNGGGTGYSGYNSYNYNSGGGGGGSDIRIGGQTLADRYIVAGGGGGAGCSGCTGGGLPGGHGGGLAGQDGGDTQPSCFPGCNNGKGGTQITGGDTGNWACQCATVNSMLGMLGVGGDGDGSGCAVTCGSGGAGGGGYYGGGGGSAGPGGGGSSYANPGATNVVHTQGYQIQNGQVIIDYTPLAVTEITLPTEFTIVPNPAESMVSVIMGNRNSTEGTFALYDITGKIIKSWYWKGEQNMQLDMSAYAAGTYSLVLATEKGTSTQRIIRK